MQTEERRRSRFARVERGGGSALLGVLVLGLVLSLMAGLGLHLVVSEIRLNRAFCDGIRAYYLAESGLVYGLAQARTRLEQGQEPPFQIEGAVDSPFRTDIRGVYETPHGFGYAAAVEENRPGAQQGGGQAPAEPPALPPGQAKKSETSPDGTGSGPGVGGPEPEAAGGTGGAGGQDAKDKEKECRVVLSARGWYGPREDPGAVRVMEAAVVLRKQSKDAAWELKQVEYWRQAAPAW